MLPQHRGDLPPAIDPAQPDQPARHKAEEQDQRRVIARQRALRLHAESDQTSSNVILGREVTLHQAVPSAVGRFTQTFS